MAGDPERLARFQREARAAPLAQLGAQQAAQRALQDLLALRPNFAAEAREEYNKWYDPEDADKILACLRKAGLPGGTEPPLPSSATNKVPFPSTAMPTI
jgi:hypothetical protein